MTYPRNVAVFNLEPTKHLSLLKKQHSLSSRFKLFLLVNQNPQDPLARKYYFSHSPPPATPVYSSLSYRNWTVIFKKCTYIYTYIYTYLYCHFLSSFSVLFRAPEGRPRQTVSSQSVHNTASRQPDSYRQYVMCRRHQASWWCLQGKPSSVYLLFRSVLSLS